MNTVSMKDISAVCGVSIATVSKPLKTNRTPRKGWMSCLEHNWYRGFDGVMIACVDFDDSAVTQSRRLENEVALKFFKLIENPKSMITEQIIVTGKLQRASQWQNLIELMHEAVSHAYVVIK